MKSMKEKKELFFKSALINHGMTRDDIYNAISIIKGIPQEQIKDDEEKFITLSDDFLFNTQDYFRETTKMTLYSRLSLIKHIIKISLRYIPKEHHKEILQELLENKQEDITEILEEIKKIIK